MRPASILMGSGSVAVIRVPASPAAIRTIVKRMKWTVRRDTAVGSSCKVESNRSDSIFAQAGASKLRQSSSDNYASLSIWI